ncbi:MAG: hypothetical protein QXW90_02065 [Candidatus Micrarchaeaceae archaeon]
MLSIFKIVSLPGDVDYRNIIEAMLGADFMLYHELSTLSTYLICSDPGAALRLKNAVAGIDFETASLKINAESPTAIVAYAEERRGQYYDQKWRQPTAQRPAQTIGSLFNILGGIEGWLLVAFIHTGASYINALKRKIEGELSKHEKRLTQSDGQKAKFGGISSAQIDLYYDSDELMLLESLLEMLNEALISGGNAYKVTFVADSAGNGAQILEYIKSKMYVIDEYRIDAADLESLYGRIAKADAIPFSYARAASVLSFPHSIKRLQSIETSEHISRDGSIVIGKYLEKSIGETGRCVAVNPEVFNLGVIITGLPGTGKTYAAMNIISQIRRVANPMLAIIAPTSEWSEFAVSNGISAIKLYESGTPLNFFACDAEINVERFYENLAMLIASASNAGPYKNSLEKVLLAAFRGVYSKSRRPDPIDVYDAIEEAVVEQHAKRTNVGIKYTKHGENVRAALENLRLMLFRPEFAASSGASFYELLRRGVMFDLSNVSNNMKPFFYSLILNQVYSFADSFGIDNEGRLNMVIVAEEAQLVFGIDSPATLDLVQRIQDFRKKGIGLFMLTHSVTEIDPNIRRMCQTKLYFRQSPDTAKIAISDLSFADGEGALERIKTMEQQTCALGYLNAAGKRREPFESIFVRIPEFKSAGRAGGNSAEAHEHLSKQSQLCDSVVKVVDASNAPIPGLGIELFYVWEKVASSKTDADGIARFSGTLKGKRYRIVIKGERKKDARAYDIAGGALSSIVYQ